MTHTSTPYSDGLLGSLEARLTALAENPPAADAPAHVKANYAAKLRRLRRAAGRVRGSHTSAEWEAILVETGGICVRCGRRPDVICKGYVVPLYRAGSDDISNLMPVCKSCASAKEGEGINWLEYWRANRQRPLDTESTDA